MKIWTIQPLSVLDEINKKGNYVCNKELSPNLDTTNFINAYDWLVSKMEEKIGKRPTYVKYPVWAWHTCYGKNKKPDLRRMDYQYGKYLETLVCIELEIPDNEVVLSDEPNWTCYILNNSYFNTALSEEEWDKNYDYFNALPYDKKEEVKLASWDNVFNVKPFTNEFVSNGQHVQATFWELKKEYIKNITYFISKTKF